MIHYEVIYEVGGHASQRLLLQTCAPTDPACDLSEDGRKQARAPSRVCSGPTGEQGSRFEYKMSPAGSRAKRREGKQASGYIRREIGDLIKLFQALGETL